jgi:hypothetical protein
MTLNNGISDPILSSSTERPAVVFVKGHGSFFMDILCDVSEAFLPQMRIAEKVPNA